jgi:KTSC domain
MERKPVDSSMLASVGYDPSSQTLELEFQDGAIWQYLNVPESEFTSLMASDSLGTHTRNCIIGHYPEVRISSKTR